MPIPSFHLTPGAFLLTIALASIGRAEDPAAIEALKRNQPRDVAAFINRAFICWHFAGEEPYNEDRRQEIIAALKKNTCDNLAADESRLRKKYRRKPSVLKAIDATKEWR